MPKRYYHGTSRMIPVFSVSLTVDVTMELKYGILFF